MYTICILCIFKGIKEFVYISIFGTDLFVRVLTISLIYLSKEISFIYILFSFYFSWEKAILVIFD